MPRVVPQSQTPHLDVESFDAGLDGGSSTGNVSSHHQQFLSVPKEGTHVSRQNTNKSIFFEEGFKSQGFDRESDDSVEEKEEENPLSTGRNWMIDCCMSLRMIVVVMSIVQLLITCLMIWVTTVICVNLGVVISIDVISIITWVTFALVAFLSIGGIIVLHFLFLKKPLASIVIELSKMSQFKYDDCTRMKYLFTEFIPLTVLLWDVTTTLKHIRPFIPKNLIPDENELEYDDGFEEERERQLNEIRKMIASRKQASKNSLLSEGGFRSNITPGGRSSKSVKSAKSTKSKISAGTTAIGSKRMIQKQASKAILSLELGLSPYMSTVLVIQFRNFDGNSYPIATDLLGVFSMFYQKVQSVCKQFKGKASILTPKVVMVVFENGRNHEKNSLLCAINLTKQLLAVNNQLREQVKIPELEFGIGVSRSESLVGNIGTSQMKYYSLIGECTSSALKLASLNTILRTRVLTDESMANALLSGIVSRPVHFSKKKTVLGNAVVTLNLEESSTQTIFEVIGEDKVNDDEWLYELQQQENSKKYQIFSSAFETLKSRTFNQESLRAVLDVLKDYIDIDEKDVVVSTLYDHLTPLSKLNNQDLRDRMRTFCLEEYDIELCIDPTHVI